VCCLAPHSNYSSRFLLKPAKSCFSSAFDFITKYIRPISELAPWVPLSSFPIFLCGQCLLNHLVINVIPGITTVHNVWSPFCPCFFPISPLLGRTSHGMAWHGMASWNIDDHVRPSPPARWAPRDGQPVVGAFGWSGVNL